MRTRVSEVLSGARTGTYGLDDYVEVVVVDMSVHAE